MMYQVGVLISRSSLNLIKVKRIDILTGLQFLNFIFWGILAYFKFLDLIMCFLLQIVVGIMGGAAYVNVFYLILEDKSIKDN